MLLKGWSNGKFENRFNHFRIALCVTGVPENRRILWFDEIPYIVVGYRVYACHQGPDTNVCVKRNRAERQAEKVNSHMC